MLMFPGYQIIETLYESSQSLVCRGLRTSDRTPVVLKALQEHPVTPAELRRFKQEYRIIRHLNQFGKNNTKTSADRGVIVAYGLETYQRSVALILEDCGATSLKLLISQRRFSILEFLQLAIATTEALGSIHAADIIHKDINPNNIIFNPQSKQLKIIDFGISSELSSETPTFKNLPILEGTLAYLSPEQTGRMNRSLDYRTDFYSLGATFYELLTNQLPFTTQDPMELVHCHLAKQPLPPHLQAEEQGEVCPHAISAIVMKLMSKKAEDRYQTTWGLKADLEKCLFQLQHQGKVTDFSLGSQDLAEKFKIPEQLYGREIEVRTLLSAFERITATNSNLDLEEDRQFSLENSPGNRLGLLLISGYSGIGKSVLVQELYKPVTEKRGYFIVGKFDQFQRNIPCSALVNAFQGLIRQILTESECQLQEWRQKLLDALGPNGQVMIDVIPQIELIIGKQSPVPRLRPADADNRFNLVFQKFIRVFCDTSHPLVIFLDDLQWVDAATLKLLELILIQSQIQFLFLIAAYRNNEVFATHPLRRTLESWEKKGAAIEQITLVPLALEHVNHLIADTLHRDIDSVMPLAKLVFEKTEGNPFFINEFLKKLYAESLIYFEPSNCNWQWDLTQIESKDITENVVQLMIDKLKSLPELTQHILRLAACLGAEFDLSSLSIITEKSPKEIFSELTFAVKSGLVLQISDGNSQWLLQNYKFLHDRVQQAAYLLIQDEEKTAIHLQIGRLLLQNSDAKTLLEKIFEIVDHFNHGIELIGDRDERYQIARFNLLAGQKAKAATAYGAANQYFSIGIELLSPDSYEIDYDLSLTLYQEAAETAYLNGDFLRMGKLAEVVQNSAKTLVEKVKIYDIKIQSAVSQGDLKGAIEMGLEVLTLLGVILPTEPSLLDVKFRLEETASLWEGREIESFIHLPLMTQAKSQAALYILSSIAAAAFIVAHDLMLLIVLSMVNLSIKFGSDVWSPYGYAAYGLILCTFQEDIEAGYQFGRLALNLAEQLKDRKGKAKVFNVWGTHILSWKEHLSQTLPILMESYHCGIEVGDFETAGFCACYICKHSYFMGCELTELEQQMTISSQAIAQIRRETPWKWLGTFWQAVLNLLGHSENPLYLMGDAYNEERSCLRAIQANDRTELNFLYLNKLILCYLFGDALQAVENANLARQYLDGVTGMVVVSILYFYDSLACLSLGFEIKDDDRDMRLQRVDDNLTKLKKWAHHAPMNYKHKVDLVEAEKARVRGQYWQASEFYEQAIQGARENGYIQEEGLAYELTAKFYESVGRIEIAKLYMNRAHECYLKWGATAKVKDLEKKYNRLIISPLESKVKVRSEPSPIKPPDRSSGFSAELDLATFLKASQAVSGEIVLDKLLNKLMKILVENAGATKGVLVLETNDTLLIEAEATEAGETVLLQSLPLDSDRNGLPIVPIQTIHYVARVKELVVLSNAVGESKFANDPYLQQVQPQSILCSPLVNQGKLMGILYLENSLTTEAFTPERVEILNLLSTQAAIAITHAKLYQEVRESESQLKQFLEAVPIAIGILDATGRPYFVNHLAQELLNQGVQSNIEATEIAQTYKLYIADSDREYPNEKLPIIRALNGERSTADDIEIRYGDKRIPIEAWGSPIYGEQGNLIYAITAFQDITQRKRAEKILSDYNRTLAAQVAERTAELAQVNAEMQSLNLELQRLASIDGLTQVSNRRSFDRYLVQAWQDCFQERHPLSLILCDVDFFKNYNDFYGHQKGDDCLQQVAQAMMQVVKRPTDLVSRYGGEEFAIILLDTAVLEAMAIAQSIHAKVQRLKIPHVRSQVSQYVTLSMGIASILPTPGISPDSLISGADEALYLAKRQGRDRTIFKEFNPDVGC